MIEFQTDLKVKDSLNFRFKELISKIEDESNNTANPRGLKVKESLITGFDIDPNFPCADFESRGFNWKYFAGELAWYLLKSRKTTFIDNFSNFWANIKNPDGTINSNYGHILLTSTPPKKGPAEITEDGKYKVKESSQMSWVVNSLKKDKDSRQAIAYIGGRDFQFEGNKDFVCTQYLLFFIRNNQLHMKVQMRSNDIFYGLTYDAPWFSTVHQNVYLELLEVYPELELGQYFHYSDNTHFYERHFELAEKISTEKSNYPGPKLELLKPLWYTYPEGHTALTDEAKQYLNWINQSIERLDSMKREDFIEALSIIFKITL